MVNIMFSGNKSIFKGIVLATLSILKHYKNPLTIYLTTLDYTEIKPNFCCITPEQADFLDNLVKQTNAQSQVKLIDTTIMFKQLLYGKNHNNDYSPYTLIRLLIDKIDLPDKILYLDADIMACDDISLLYDIDISEYEFASALDYMGKFWIAKGYFNAGVTLFNRRLAIKNELFEKCRYLVNTKWFKMPDQSALYRSKTSMLILDGRFNEQRMPKQNTVVKHFNKGIKWLPFFHIYNVKQWQFDKVHNKLKIFCFDDIFEQYTELLKDHKQLIEN